jgi:bifunctional non-homologous end joining protein LigD
LVENIGTSPRDCGLIRMDRSAVPRSKRQYVHGLNSPALRLARTLAGIKRGRFPGFVEPALATLASRPPRGKAWLHEVKFDGYRVQCHVQNGIRFFTRRGHDWSERFRHLAAALAPLAAHAVILDGEVIVQTEEGRSDFHALEKALKSPRGSDRLVYYVFDLLYLDGLDLRSAAVLERKRVLQLLLARFNGSVRLSEHLQGDGPAIWRRACAIELEGIVSKRSGGRYRSGRSDNWIKSTCRHRDTFAVVGWAEKNKKFDGLYLGRKQDGELSYAGKLERGISSADQRALLDRLRPLRVRARPIKNAPRNFPKARWVSPRLLVDAEFRGKTATGLLRHPSFKGVREDLL